jgi:hypothetical protein
MKRGPKNIEEYVARCCALSLQSKRIKELEEELRYTNHRIDQLCLIKIRYEIEFLQGSGKGDFCGSCKSYFKPSELTRCAGGERCIYRLLCVHCLGNNICVTCGQDVCDMCLINCQVQNCRATLCKPCVDESVDDERIVCRKHVKKLKNEEEGP